MVKLRVGDRAGDRDRDRVRANAHLRAGDRDRVRGNAARVHPNPIPKRTSCF